VSVHEIMYDFVVNIIYINSMQQLYCLKMLEVLKIWITILLILLTQLLIRTMMLII
jgi:hypothetical protein